MAGHSKWANTKYRKMRQDKKREKIFTKIIREVVISTKLGGKDINTNPRLRAAVDKALSNNMNKDTLNRAIIRGLEADRNLQTKKAIYEGYGPGGTAIIVECLINKRCHIIEQIRHLFNSQGGHLGNFGSVSHLFKKSGVITLFSGINEEKIIDLALEAGATDVIINSDGTIDVCTMPDMLYVIKDALKEIHDFIKSSDIIITPLVHIHLNVKNSYRLINLINVLKNFEYTHMIHHNAKITNST